MKKKLMAGMLLALAGLSASAKADVVATFTGVASETDIHVSITDNYSNPSITGNEFVATGYYQWAGQASNPVGLQGNFNTFCIDFTQDINFNQPPYTYQLSALETAPSDTPAFQDPSLSGEGMGSVRANAIRELWGLNYASLSNPAEVAGFQLAIWKIIYEPTLIENPSTPMDVTTGNLYTTDSGAFVTFANEYLASIVSDGHYRTDDLATNLFALTNSEDQDQIVQLPGNPPLQLTLSVPAPKSVYGGVALLAGIAVMRRKGLKGNV